MRKNHLYLLFIVVAAIIVFWVAKHFLFSGPAQQQGMPPAPVTVQQITVSDIPLQFEYAGRTAGSREVEIRPRVSGIIQKRAYVEGQRVKQGTVLFKIDPAPFEAAYAQAQARLTQAQSDWARVEKLFAEKAVSPRERDEALAGFQQAQAQAKTAKINLGYTTVEAPITGVTSQEALSEGSVVSADTTLLTRLTQLDPLYVRFAYPDTDASAQRKMLASGALSLPEGGKLKTEIRFSDGTAYEQEGTVDFTDSIVDPQTGTVSSRAVLPNPDGAILPGQFVRVLVKGFVRKNAVAIPDQAIIQSPQGAIVYVVMPDGKAGVAPVTTGALVENNQRIIESGLKEGDKVITEGMIKVHPGAPVNITQPKPEGAPDAAPAEPGKKE